MIPNASENSTTSLLKGAVDIIQAKELSHKLNSKRFLTIKAGFDPSRPDLHLGHLVLLKKLRCFQDQGHQVIFVVGDFTAQIGDPSGANQTRPVLTKEEVKKNAKTYAKQACKVLNKKKLKVVYNSKWLNKMRASDLIRLSSHSTVARMLERNDFSIRFSEQKPIGLHEFLYPILQGYDSVALKADVEIGGTDQLFNLLMGRELQKHFNQEAQCVFTFSLLEGIDGVQKMSKSYGNAIAFTDSAKDIFGKTMKISDELMLNYYHLFRLCSTESNLDKAFVEKSEWLSDFFKELKRLLKLPDSHSLSSEVSYLSQPLPKIEQLSMTVKDFAHKYFSNVIETATLPDTPLKELLKKVLESKGHSFKSTKEALAAYFTETFYDQAEAKQAQKEFNLTFQKRSPSATLGEGFVKEQTSLALCTLMKEVELVTSAGEARRAIEGGGLKLLEEDSTCISDLGLKAYLNQKITDKHLKVNLNKGDCFILSIGRRKQKRVIVK